MSNTAIRRALALPMLCVLVAACGRKAQPAKASDPNAPAVVKLPLPVLASDTAKPDTMQSHLEKTNAALAELLTNYSVLGTAVVLGDRRMIGMQYAPDAVLVTPDSTYRGLVAVANALAELSSSRSLRAFRRRSLALKIVDSTVIDSGSYTLISKRPGADSLLERGVYIANWRMHPPPLVWVIKKEEMRPSAPKRKKG
jgi:hypothetical protein